jgi:hypothetical protein
MNKLERRIVENKEKLKVFVNREFNFDILKNDTSEEIAKGIKLIKNSNEFEFDGTKYEFQGKFSNGLITGFLVTARDVLEMNEYAVAFARKNVMVSSNKREDIVHESEHVLQNILGIMEVGLNKCRLEYDAYLISILYSENSKSYYKKRKKRIKERLKEMHCDFEDMRSKYNIQIGLPNLAGEWEGLYKMDRLLVNVKHTNESVREASLKLLNESYRSLLGFTYEEFIQKLKE